MGAKVETTRAYRTARTAAAGWRATQPRIVAGVMGSNREQSAWIRGMIARLHREHAERQAAIQSRLAAIGQQVSPHQIDG
jgi:methionine synthase I (cobalamin-dependent)